MLRLRAITLSIAIAAGLAVPIQLAAPTAAASTCVSDAPNRGGLFYPGPSASSIYDDTFGRGPAIPLPSHSPQGMTVWSNWDGKGNTMLLLAAYRDGSDSYLIGIDPDSGKHLGTVRTAASHFGGIGVIGSWLIGQHANGFTVRKYKLSSLRSAMKTAVKAGPGGAKPYLKAASGTQTLKHGANSMSVHANRLWVGDYSSSASSSKMYQYKVSSSGKLSKVGSAWDVPLKTQGVLVTGDRFVFVSGLTAGQITVSEKRSDLDEAKGRCFAGPSHGQNIVLHGGKVFIAFEGGSDKYADDPDTRNPIQHLHVARYSDLDDLTNP